MLAGFAFTVKQDADIEELRLGEAFVAGQIDFALLVEESPFQPELYLLRLSIRKCNMTIA